MSYWGDFPLEETLNKLFTTRAFATGIPTVLAGTPVLSVYEDTNLTQITAGVTVTVDHDGVVGLNRANVVATAANGYELGKSYSVVITTGTVDSVSVVGEVIGMFTIGRSAAAQDLANATDGLGAIKAETADILTDTAEIGTAGAGLTNINLPNQTMDITGNITGSVSGSVGSVTGAVGSVTGSVGSVVGHTAQTGDTFALANGASGFVATKNETALIVADTNELQTDWADAGRLDAILDSRMAEASIDTTAGAVDTVTTLTGHTAQSGDSFARIGAGGASLTDLGGMSAAMQAEVLAEVNSALDTAISELAQAQPTATPSIRTGIMLMYMALRNRLDVQTSGTDALEIRNAAGTIVAKKLLTDDGSDYSEALMASGP